MKTRSFIFQGTNEQTFLFYVKICSVLYDIFLFRLGVSFKKDPDDYINPLKTNPVKWSNTLKQFVGNLSTNCLSVFDHFVRLGLKGFTLQQPYAYKTAEKKYL